MCVCACLRVCGAARPASHHSLSLSLSLSLSCPTHTTPTHSPQHHTQHPTTKTNKNSTYKLSVGGFCNLDLTQALNGQPLQLTCKDTKTGEYSFSMLVWHEKLLYDAPGGAAEGNSLSDAFSKMRLGFKGYFSRGGVKSAGGAE